MPSLAKLLGWGKARSTAEDSDTMARETSETPTDAAAELQPAVGIPEWILSSVFHFLEPVFAGRGPDAYAGPMFGTGTQRDFVKEVERTFRIKLDWRNGRTSASRHLATLISTDNELLVNVVDYALRNIGLGYDYQHAEDAASELNRALAQGGSEQGVVALPAPRFGFQLRRRTTEAASAAAAAQIATTGNASEHLSRAWLAAYGQQPEPTLAYSQAVKAVEAAAIPLVLPNDPLATLGKIVGQMRGSPQKYSAAFTRESGGASAGTPLTSIEVIISLADLLWRNQTDRHAAGDPQATVPVSQPQAEWAVHIALLLVQTFRSGAIS